MSRAQRELEEKLGRVLAQTPATRLHGPAQLGSFPQRLLMLEWDQSGETFGGLEQLFTQG